MYVTQGATIRSWSALEQHSCTFHSVLPPAGHQDAAIALPILRGLLLFICFLCRVCSQLWYQGSTPVAQIMWEMVLHEFKLSTASETCVDSHPIKPFTILCCLRFHVDQICNYSSLSNQNTLHNSWLLISDFEILIEITGDYLRIQEIAREY